MARYAHSDYTHEDIIKLIHSGREHGESNHSFDDIASIIYDAFHRGSRGINASVFTKMVKDIREKVFIDFANLEVIDNTGYNLSLEAYDYINDIPVIWFVGGSDDDVGVVFCVYIDKDYKLRAYLPIPGNGVDPKTKDTLTGWDYTLEEDEVDEEEGIKLFKYDEKLMREAAEDRIIRVGDTKEKSKKVTKGKTKEKKVPNKVIYCKSGLTEKDLEDKIYSVKNRYCRNDFDCYVQTIISNESRILPDEDIMSIPGIANFDIEEFDMINDIPVLWIKSCDDCEGYSYFVLFIDENDNIRAYTPVKGNHHEDPDNRPDFYYDNDFDDYFDKCEAEIDMAVMTRELKKVLRTR